MTDIPNGEPATITDIQNLKSAISELNTDISELRSELRSDLREIQQSLNRRIDGVEARLHTHDLRFDSELIRQQTRTFVLATTGSMVTLSAVAFGAAALI